MFTHFVLPFPRARRGKHDFGSPGNLLRECSMKPFPPACRGNRYFRVPLETLGVFGRSAHDGLFPSACRGKGRLEAWEASKSIAERYDPLYLSMKRVSPCLPGAPGGLLSNLSNHAVPHCHPACRYLFAVPVEQKAISRGKNSGLQRPFHPACQGKGNFEASKASKSPREGCKPLSLSTKRLR